MNISDLLKRRRRAYQDTFNGPAGKKVLADLKRFCRATVPTANLSNPNETYLLEGRREVWLRIAAHLNLTDEDVYSLTEHED